MTYTLSLDCYHHYLDRDVGGVPVLVDGSDHLGGEQKGHPRSQTVEHLKNATFVIVSISSGE